MLLEAFTWGQYDICVDSRATTVVVLELMILNGGVVACETRADPAWRGPDRLTNRFHEGCGNRASGWQREPLHERTKDGSLLYRVVNLCLGEDARPGT